MIKGEKAWTVFLFSVGLFSLILGLTYGSLMLKQACYDNNFACPEYWLNRYQTLIGALIALATAVWGIAALYRIEDNKWQSKRAAARAVLPLTLSGISEYIGKCAPLLVTIHDKCKDGVLPKEIPIPEFPSLPVEAIAGLKEMVEFSYPAERTYISKLLARIQIQSTRIAGMIQEHLRPEHITSSDNLDAYLIDAAAIYARSSSLYKFARGDEDKMPIQVTNREVAVALHNMRIFDETYDRLCKILGLSEDIAAS